MTAGLDLALWIVEREYGPGKRTVREGGTAPRLDPTGGYWRSAGWRCCWQAPATPEILPGRKTDVADAAWLAGRLEHGLQLGSFVPPPVIRQLRNLTRYRKQPIQATPPRPSGCTRPGVEDAGIKLDSVAA
jgi:hypothetical protein